MANVVWVYSKKNILVKIRKLSVLLLLRTTFKLEKFVIQLTLCGQVRSLDKEQRRMDDIKFP